MLQASNTSETRTTARELKFLVSPEEAAEIRRWARANLGPDPFATGEFQDEYGTTSLYFDTPNLDVYHRRGSFKRSKYRIRRYGHENVVFLERKLRTGTLLSKRRTTIDINDLERFRSAPDRAWPGYWFHQRIELRRLAVTCQVSYQRVARMTPTSRGPIRLTLDRRIRVQPANEPVFHPDHGIDVLPAQIVLELKFRHELPSLFRSLVDQFALTALTVSKYRLALEALSRGDSGHRHVSLVPHTGQARINNA